MLSIIKRNSVYYFRVRVPADVRKHFPAGEVVRSLHTGLYRQAKSLARGKLGALERVFMTIRAGVLTDDEIQKLVEKYKREWLDKSETDVDQLAAGWGSSYKDGRQMLAEVWTDQEDLHKHYLLNERGLDEQTVYTALELIGKKPKEEGIYPDEFTPEFKKLCRAVALANKEVYTTILERNETGDSAYDRQERAKPKSKTLKELMAQYVAEKRDSWEDPQSTIAIHNRILHIFGNVRLDSIDRARCIEFREELKDYPLKNTDFKTPWRTLAKKKKTRISERTQNGTVSELITLFKYAADADMGIRGNPAAGLLKSKEDCTPVKKREAYTRDELQRMVAELAKVDRVRNPESFWIPLLLLYTGARSNEICMLRVADVADGILYFRNKPELAQRTKNKKDRQAPVHSHLVGLGFLDFVERQRKAGQDRLFSNLKVSNGKWNVDYGKQYGRTFKLKFLSGSKSQLQSKDLHSFRKTFVDWYVKSGLADDVVGVKTLQSVVGHCEAEELKHLMDFVEKSKLTIEGYGGGFDVDQKSFIEKLNYGVDLSGLRII